MMTDSEWDSSAPVLMWLASLLSIMSTAIDSTGDNLSSEVKVVGMAFIRSSGDFWCQILNLLLQKEMRKFNFCCVHFAIPCKN